MERYIWPLLRLGKGKVFSPRGTITTVSLPMTSDYEVILRNGERKFTALSNFHEKDVFCKPLERKWNRIVIFLHGFPDNNKSFNELRHYLKDEFSRKDKPLFLSPAMRGYEPSSQGNDSEYGLHQISTDIYAWVEQLKNGQNIPVHLVGHDWGALCSFKVASNWPGLITSMACLAIPYLANIRIWELLYYCPEQLYLSSYMLTMQSSLIYTKKLLGADGGDYLADLWGYWSPTWNIPQSALEDVKYTLRQPGVVDGATAYYRCMFKPLAFSDRRWPVDFDRTPTLILGGLEDRCMSRRLYDLEKRKLKDVKTARVKLIPGIGHFLHREDPQKVAQSIGEWFAIHK